MVTVTERTSLFPEGLHDETNYSRQTIAVVLILIHAANVANYMAKQMLYELTCGARDVFAGWIAKNPPKFRMRSQEELQLIFKDLF